MLNKQGKVVEIVKIASEVTERVTQAQEHRSLLAALNRSMAMIAFTPQGTIVSANDNMLALMGYRLEEACGQSHAVLCPPEFAASDDYRRHWQRLARGEFITGVLSASTGAANGYGWRPATTRSSTAKARW